MIFQVRKLSSNNLEKSQKKVFFLACIGNVLEFYDFSIFFFLLPSFSDLFFPAHDHITSVILGFSIFFLGFLARPIGSIVFGFIGDQRGRRQALSFSLLGMALSNVLIAFLPTYFEIGIWAPLALVILRIIHGLCIGGEFVGSLIFLVEHIKGEQGPLYTACLVSSSILGWFVGSFSCLLLMSVSGSWRIPFLFGGLTGIVGFVIRKYTQESSYFINRPVKQRKSFKDLVTIYRLEFFTIFVTGGLIGSLFYGLFIFPNVYLTELIGLTKEDASQITTIGIGIYMFILPCAGLLAIKLGPYKLIIYSAILTIFASFPIFLFLSSGSFVLSIFAEFIAAILIASFIGPASFIMVQFFPTEVRYTFAGISYNLGVSILGGLFPVICHSLIKWSGYLSIPSAYLIFCGSLVLLAYSFFIKTKDL